AELKKAFRTVIAKEFSHIPEDENSIDYTFSERFNKRMARLIKSQRKSYWVLINTAAKRAAVMFVAILTLFTAAFSVKAIREPVLKFIKQVYETFTDYLFEGDTTITIDKEYVITNLPEGFEQISKIQNDFIITTKYENDKGDCVVFSQQISRGNSGYAIDSEQGNIIVEKVDGIDVIFKEFHNVKTAIWLKDGYVFIIDCHGDISFNIIEQLIMSVK
ncbi:MAG: DUF4367 domain-containing protein, partial [Clostridia bacterium]|nr:DUF4367 domain-containing protein [Clostridia bacterium]